MTYSPMATAAREGVRGRRAAVRRRARAGGAVRRGGHGGDFGPAVGPRLAAVRDGGGPAPLGQHHVLGGEPRPRRRQLLPRPPAGLAPALRGHRGRPAAELARGESVIK